MTDAPQIGITETPITKPPGDVRALFVAALDCVTALCRALIDAGLLTPQQLSDAYQCAIAELDRQEPLFDPEVRGMGIRMLANIFAKQAQPPKDALN